MNGIIKPILIKSKAHFLVFFLIFLSTAFSCKENTPVIPPPPEPELTLTVDDVSCTEAWLNLKLENVTLPFDLELKRDSIVTKTFLAINATDTTLYIDSLLPNQTYKFQSVIQSINHSSNEVSVATMDTTSHNFAWQTLEFGTIGSSVLYDVAIIDENNIWAVGEIMIADTSLNGYTTYNAVHWDGNEWELLRMMFYTICGQPDRSSYPIKAIFAFNENEIWVGSDGRQIAKISGITQVETICPPFSMVINKIWGTSSADLYVVGNNGNIAHYNGTNWQRIESGTTLNINDIWGDYNNKTGEWEIMAVASNILQSFDKEVLKINESTAVLLDKNGINETLRSVWFQSERKYYAVGSGTYEKTFLSDSIWRGAPLDITNYFENRIRANNITDIFIVGAFGETLHFNGYSWKSFINETFLSNGTYLSVGIKNNLVVSVGYQSTQAIITIGNR